MAKLSKNTIIGIVVAVVVVVVIAIVVGVVSNSGNGGDGTDGGQHIEIDEALPRYKSSLSPPE